MLQTARLKLIPLSSDHFKFFAELDQNPDVMKFIRETSTSMEESQERFKVVMEYNQAWPGFGGFLVETHAGEPVGLGVIIHIERKPENEKYEIGYRLSPAAWGKGYASEISQALLDYGFMVLGLEEIYGTTNPDHVVSQKVLQKAGMKYVGKAPYYKESTVYVIRRPEFLAAQAARLHKP